MVVPSSRKDLGVHTFSLTNIREAESRIHEIAVVNRTKAPELLACFNVAFLNLSNYTATLKAEQILAKRRLREVSAMVILDRAPQILLDRGLPQSKDLREAVMMKDLEYLSALDQTNMIEATLEFLEGKKEAITMAYTAVKRLLPDASTSMTSMARVLNGKSS